MRPLTRTLASAIGSLLLAATLFARCQTEPLTDRLSLTFEPFNSTKAAVSGAISYWCDGDAVLINNTETQVELTSSGAYASGVPSASSYRAIYPANIASAPLGETTAQVQLPAVYHYRTQDNRQLLELPMAAMANAGENIKFRHLTGALYIVITNDYSFSLAIDSLIVASDKYQLSGSQTVSFAGLTSHEPVATTVSADRAVALTFDHQRLTLEPNSSITVMIPILPVGSDNHFTVTLTTHDQGKRYTYRRTQSTGGALARNELGYVPVDMSNSATYITDHQLFPNGVIASPLDLILLSEACENSWIIVNSGSTLYSSQSYTLTSDLDMTGYTINPISLSGLFDGNSHTISHLTVNSKVNGSNVLCGLFSGTKVKVSNLTLTDLTLSCNATGSIQTAYIGAFGCNATSDTLNNCHINGLTVDVTNSPTQELYLGSLIGSASKVQLTNCTVKGNISLPETSLSCQVYLGGLMGRAYGSASSKGITNISGCTINPTTAVSMSSATLLYAGGFVGQALNSNLTINNNSSWNGELQVSGNNVYAAGFLGRMLSGVTADITNCSASGSLSATVANTDNAKLAKYIGQRVSGMIRNDFNDCSADNFSISLNGSEVENPVLYN